jgi:hypothetical protein
VNNILKALPERLKTKRRGTNTHVPPFQSEILLLGITLQKSTLQTAIMPCLYQSAPACCDVCINPACLCWRARSSSSSSLNEQPEQHASPEQHDTYHGQGESFLFPCGRILADLVLVWPRPCLASSSSGRVLVQPSSLQVFEFRQHRCWCCLLYRSIECRCERQQYSLRVCGQQLCRPFVYGPLRV